MLKDDVVKAAKHSSRSTQVPLMKAGGSFLGRIRLFIESKFFNGSRVLFGSKEVLTGGNFTVDELEHLACDIAADTLNEYSRHLVTEAEIYALKAYLNPKNWQMDSEGNYTIFKPNRDNMHFLAAFRHKHGYDIVDCIEGTNKE